MGGCGGKKKRLKAKNESLHPEFCSHFQLKANCKKCQLQLLHTKEQSELEPPSQK